ncbi:NACHT domain-containing protein [Pseudomonas migulae]
MSAALTAIALTKIISPIFSDLYTGAKGVVRDGLKRWSTTSGIKKAATALLRLEKVKTIWSPEEETSLRQFYYPSKLKTKVQYGQDESIIDATNIANLPDRNIVIEGIVGQGKSIFMRHLATSILCTSPLETIPVFIELRTISTKRSLLDTIFSFLDSLGVTGNQPTFDYLAESQILTLLLDGFDEIPSDCVGDVIFHLGNIQTRHPDLKIIISSRPRNHIQNTPGFQVLELVKLNQSDYDPFISKLINSKPKRFDVVEALNESPDNIKGIISTPLMLTLVVIVYQTEKEIPSTLSDFFEKLFGTVFTKHDRLKAGFNRQHFSGLSERKLKQLFDTFCFMVIQSGGTRSLDSNTFECAFDNAINYAPECKCDIDNFRNDIVKVACLMVEEGFDTTTFLHKSILDYHAAAFIKSLPDRTASEFYSSAFQNYRLWNYVIDFLKSIDTIRYYRFFVVKLLKKPVAQLSKVLQSADIENLIDYLEEILPDFTFDFENYELKTIGPFPHHGVEFYGRIGDAITSSMPDGFDDSFDKSELDKAVKLSRRQIPTLKGQCITIRQYIDVFNPTSLWTELLDLETELNELCTKAQLELSHEKTKDGLFKELLVKAPDADDLDLFF